MAGDRSVRLTSAIAAAVLIAACYAVLGAARALDGLVERIKG